MAPPPLLPQPEEPGRIPAGCAGLQQIQPLLTFNVAHGDCSAILIIVTHLLPNRTTQPCSHTALFPHTKHQHVVEPAMTVHVCTFNMCLQAVRGSATWTTQALLAPSTLPPYEVAALTPWPMLDCTAPCGPPHHRSIQPGYSTGHPCPSPHLTWAQWCCQGGSSC
jgi:hypothetical protein